MPTYEFQCQKCGRFERQMSMKEARDLFRCPSCGEMAHRAYGVPNVLTPRQANPNTVRVVQRDSEEKQATDSSGVHRAKGSLPSRPWMIGH